MQREKCIDIVCFLFVLSILHTTVLQGQSGSDVTRQDSARASANDTTKRPLSDGVNEINPQVHPVRLALVITGAAGIVTLAHVQNYNTWWRGTTSAFHFGDDGRKYLHYDKLGHFIFTYVTSDIMGRSFVWAGIPPKKAFLYGGTLALAFQTYVEIEDAFHADLGFSTGDQIANTLGAAMPFLQNEVHFFSKLKFKWSAIPSLKYQQGRHRTIVDDYESQYYWISANVRELFGTSSSLLPNFLNVAIGFGVKNLDFRGNGNPEVYLAFDVDMEKLPGKGDFLQTIKHALNYIHFPAPAIRFTPHVVFYGFRF